jgi:asparagine synthase (glutamine-hydrolysing)
MCGICGKAALSSGDRVNPATVERMTEALYHRGPDDHGMYVTDQVVLGHRRLSIIDLNTGKQPICNEDRTIWIVYNGEIYNFKELKQQLVESGHIFTTNTDTEVIVHLYEQFGEECLSKLRGMFAFALWDARKRVLFLARDRVGIKPLYYVRTQDSLIFASEMKALLVDPSVKREVAPQVIDTFLTYLYTPGCETLIRDIQKLEPGHYLKMEDGKVRIRKYWDLEFAFNHRNGNFKAATEELVELLRETVRDHMISDVPVGILLSGGVDSTGVLSFAMEQTDRDVNTFTIGFDGEQFADERVYARLAAQRFGNKHYEMTITPRDFEEFLPKYVWHMEEPVCEPPAVALYYVTKLARQHVKVLLSGEGGDEAFAGYQNYRNMLWLERLKAVSGPWTGLGARILHECGRVRALRRFEKYSFMMKMPLERYYYSRTAGPFSFFNRTKSDLYSREFGQEVDSSCSTKIASDFFARVAGEPPLNKMLYVDTKTWLPDDLLVKADKITMANSLELRVPLLDHKVLEFAARLPSNYKVRGFTTKYILKKALGGRVPGRILNRKKTGFPVPLTSWFGNQLRDFACGILTDRRTLERGYFDRGLLRSLVSDSSKRADLAPEIFSLVTLELWHRAFIDGINPTPSVS